MKTQVLTLNRRWIEQRRICKFPFITYLRTRRRSYLRMRLQFRSLLPDARLVGFRGYECEHIQRIVDTGRRETLHRLEVVGFARWRGR